MISNNSATSTDFSSIATRIQERAIQLNDERAILSESKKELTNLQTIIQNECNENKKVKQMSTKITKRFKKNTFSYNLLDSFQ